jgi:hypothetical protein
MAVQRGPVPTVVALATSHGALFAVVLCLFLSGFDCSARHGPGIC